MEEDLKKINLPIALTSSCPGRYLNCDEPGVEVDPVEGPDAATGGVGEELTVEQHHPADEVEPQEHRQGESNVHRHPL